MSRGCLYMVWGNAYDAALERSISSLKKWHPELPCHVERMPDDSTVLCKSRMYDLSPFEETLYLDADTTVLGNLEYGFLMAGRSGIAVTHSANPWQRRYHKMEPYHPDESEYSSGVVFFDKLHPVPERVFGMWGRLTKVCDTETKYAGGDGVETQAHNDQALLTYALHGTGHIPFVLPLNWLLQPKWHKCFFGEIKIGHAIEPSTIPLLEKWNEGQTKPGAVIRAAVVP